MREQFMATVQLIRGEGRLVRATLLLALGLLLLVSAIRYGHLTFALRGIPYSGYLLSVLGAPIYAICVAFPGLVLLHAVAQRASGYPVPFLASCKAVLYRLPSWIVPVLILYAVNYALTMYIVRWPFPIFQVEFFGLLFPGELGPLVDMMIGHLGTAFVLFIIAAPVLARLMFMIPAFTVLDRHGFDTARRISSALTAWRDVYLLVPFLLLVFVAAYVDPWALIRAVTGEVSVYSGHLVQTRLDFVVSSAVRTLMLQTAIALLILATLPAWFAIREGAAEKAAVYEADRGRRFTRKRFPWLGYIALALSVIAVHFGMMAFYILELMSIGSSGRGLLWDSREAMESSILPLLASLPLVPFAYFMEQPVDIRLGGVAWAVTTVVILEAYRRFRRHRMAINNSSVAGDGGST